MTHRLTPFRRWCQHTERQLRYNAFTLTLRTPHPVGHSNSHCRGEPRRRQGSDLHFTTPRAPTTSIEYTLDSSHQFPSPFLSATPRFTTSVDPKLRGLPCVLILHGMWPGGFDVARWYAGGLALANLEVAASVASNDKRHENHWSATLTDSISDHPDVSVQTATTAPSTRHVHPANPFTSWRAGSPLALLSVSRPGYLNSTPLAALGGHSDFASEATVLHRMLDVLNIPQVAVVAFGTGTQVGLHMAEQRMDRVHSLVMVDPIVPHNSDRRGCDTSYWAWNGEPVDPCLVPALSSLTKPAAGRSDRLWNWRAKCWADFSDRTGLTSWLAFRRLQRASPKDPTAAPAVPPSPPLSDTLADSAACWEAHHRAGGVCYAWSNHRYPGIRADLRKLGDMSSPYSPPNIDWRASLHLPILGISTKALKHCHPSAVLSPSFAEEMRTAFGPDSQAVECAAAEEMESDRRRFPLEEISRHALAFWSDRHINLD